MKIVTERRWVKDASIVAMSLFAILSMVVYLALQTAHASLDERQAQLAVLRAMQRSCELGIEPDESELAVVASLFPEHRLTCARIDDAIYLAFADEAVVAPDPSVVVQAR